MNRLFSFVIALSLLACSRQDTPVEPEPEPSDPTEINFQLSGGIAGLNQKLKLTPNSQQFEWLLGGAPKQCNEPLTAAEWKAIRQSFNREAFQKLPTKARGRCCDFFTYRLTVKDGNTTETREWDDPMLSEQDSLVRQLQRRMSAFSIRCR